MDSSGLAARGERSARLLALLALVLAAGSAGAADSPSGEEIYRQRCASCHGASGEGSDDGYDQPLAGDRSLAELTTVIEKTMPEDDPGSCVGDDARQVAQYIYDTFYSPLAQARMRPARVELSRLTVRQFENVVADLVGSFGPRGRVDDQRGLAAEYAPARREQGGERLRRVDGTVDFNFGKSSPLPGKIKPESYSGRWQGSVFAPDSGSYTLIVETANGARLWLNDMERPLIDAGVKSGSETRYQGTLRLLGGRWYPLRLEWSKRNEPQGSIRLLWKLPRRTEETIPERCLAPKAVPTTFVLSTAFPPDDRSMGFERGSSVSREWDQAVTAAALETADYVAQHLAPLANGKPERRWLREGCLRFVERAFGRPLAASETQLYVDQQFAAAQDDETAVRRIVILTLKSPRFLYGSWLPSSDGHQAAAKLAMVLWDSIADEELRRAALAGALDERQQARHAERMAGDERALAKLRQFFLQWLRVDQSADIAKDAKTFPQFSDATVTDLRTSLDLALDEVLRSERCDFRQFLSGDSVYLNGRLARLYGVDLGGKTGFVKTKLPGGSPAGLLAHPYVLSNFAYTATSSPIHRGVFLARSVLGRSLRPPPQAFAPLAADLHPRLTTRQRVELQTQPESCQSCHALINPLGFSLEHYDAIGRYRTEENGRPIDASGRYQTAAGSTVQFNGAEELARYLADSDEVHAAIVEQLFQYLVKQSIQAYGPETLGDLKEAFVEDDYNLRRLMARIALVAARPATAAKLP